MKNRIMNIVGLIAVAAAIGYGIVSGGLTEFIQAITK